MLNRLKGVFESFQQHEVRYVVIGGIAAVLYGVPRATFDLDILVEATPENTRRLLDALLDAGMGTASLTNVDEILLRRTLFPLPSQSHRLCETLAGIFDFTGLRRRYENTSTHWLAGLCAWAVLCSICWDTLARNRCR